MIRLLDVQSLLLALLGGTIMSSILTFLNTRKANQTTHMEAVAETLSELNDRLKNEVRELREEAKELRQEAKELRQEAKDLREELQKEQKLRRNLERRIAAIEEREEERESP